MRCRAITLPGNAQGEPALDLPAVSSAVPSAASCLQGWHSQPALPAHAGAGTPFPRGNKCLRLLVDAGARKEISRVSRGCLWSAAGASCGAWPPCTLLINVLVVLHVEMALWDGLGRKQRCAKVPRIPRERACGACDGVAFPALHPLGYCLWLGEKGWFRLLRCWEHPLGSQH